MVQTTQLGNADRLWGHLSMAPQWPWNHRHFNIILTSCWCTKPKESNSLDVRGWGMLPFFWHCYGKLFTGEKKWTFLSMWVQFHHGMNKKADFRGKELPSLLSPKALSQGLKILQANPLCVAIVNTGTFTTDEIIILHFCGEVHGQCKLSKLLFTIISLFTAPTPCPPNREFRHKPFSQHRS